MSPQPNSSVAARTTSAASGATRSRSQSSTALTRAPVHNTFRSWKSPWTQPSLPQVRPPAGEVGAGLQQLAPLMKPYPAQHVEVVESVR